MWSILARAKRLTTIVAGIDAKGTAGGSSGVELAACGEDRISECKFKFSGSEILDPPVHHHPNMVRSGPVIQFD